MKVVFRVDGEPSIGLGHMMRCLALAQGLKAKGHSLVFMISLTSKQFCFAKLAESAEIVTLPTMPKEHEPPWIMQQLKQLQADWLIIDGYEFGVKYRKELRSSRVNLALFDDNNNSGPLDVDMVINGAQNAEALDYQATAETAFLAIGEPYQVLRQEFFKVDKDNWQNRDSLTLMFGGSDPANLTILVLQLLAQSSAKMPITVITGAAYTQLPELNKVIEDSTLHVTHLHDCQNMAEVMVHTKLAVSAAGGSQFELVACATPSLLVVVADNQKLASRASESQGWCVVMDSQAADEKQIVSRCLALFQDTEKLRLMHQKALQQLITNGALSITKVLEQLSDKQA
ncbi:MAG: UDP-2,4-diacetamido-2,4,6-trideoxy-beta-L-altropyranose hydrolase [Paraglaciecola sp.]|uniref:UDP-2,4-diacetamido-2,4, 6-trideoxy-beta-L-altropyranose hydrolase n=1 Tax=Paraglaciecola sp. TaxID=1920173 RepID=UPI0032988083